MAADSDTLTLVGDLSGPVLLGLVGTPDVAARWTLSGTYTGATIVFEKVVTQADYAAANWTPLSNVVRQDTLNNLANGVISGLTNQTLDIVASNLSGLYAVRARLTAISTGSVYVQVVTTARNLTDPTAILARQALRLDQLTLGLSALLGEDLTADLTSAETL
jgi:hypothetical protein